MNRENVQKVRDHIASLPPEKFDMAGFGDAHSCGTAACIGGWAAALILKEDGNSMSWECMADALGLDEEDADRLFFPYYATSETFEPYAAGPMQAVMVMDHLLATGVPDWTVADPARTST